MRCPRNGVNFKSIIFASPNTLDHSAKSKLVVIITLVFSYSRLSRWNSKAPPAWLNGR
jgi:hypothetical protein